MQIKIKFKIIERFIVKRYFGFFKIYINFIQFQVKYLNLFYFDITLRPIELEIYLALLY